MAGQENALPAVQVNIGAQQVNVANASTCEQRATTRPGPKRIKYDVLALKGNDEVVLAADSAAYTDHPGRMYKRRCRKLQPVTHGK